MKIHGVDFSSAPNSRKPLVCATGTIQRNCLRLTQITLIPDFQTFERFLETPGPWFAGMDFPMGLPLELLNSWKLSHAWDKYVKTISGWGRTDFERRLKKFKVERDPGDKEPLRITDAICRAKSPLKLVNPPTAKMFFEGATRLQMADVSVIPFHAPASNRVVMETYPALIARLFTSNRYKMGATSSHSTSGMRETRQTILRGITSQTFAMRIGFNTELDASVWNASMEDALGDALDAVLCAVQAGWVHQQGKGAKAVVGRNHPSIVTEGWIIHPFLSPPPETLKDGIGREQVPQNHCKLPTVENLARDGSQFQAKSKLGNATFQTHSGPSET